MSRTVAVPSKSQTTATATDAGGGLRAITGRGINRGGRARASRAPKIPQTRRHIDVTVAHSTTRPSSSKPRSRGRPLLPALFICCRAPWRPLRADLGQPFLPLRLAWHYSFSRRVPRAARKRRGPGHEREQDD